MFECLSRGWLNTHTRCDSGEDNAGDLAPAELQVEVGSKERAPLSFGDQDIVRLLVQGSLDFGVVRREWNDRPRVGYPQAQTIRAGGWESHPNERHRKASWPECCGQSCGICDDWPNGMGCWQSCNSFLEIDDHERGLPIEWWVSWGRIVGKLMAHERSEKNG
jgi:hypothetical protein